MIQNSVIIPIQGYAKLEINCVSELRDLQNIPHTGRDLHTDGDDRITGVVVVEGRHLLVVALLKYQELAVVLIRLVSTVHQLVAPLVHAAHADHVSALYYTDWVEKYVELSKVN